MNSCLPRKALGTGKIPKRKRGRNRGFALVVTLSLMALLCLLAVGLLGLSSVEIRNSGHRSAVLQARANARLAFQMAIGELQKELGPDQRISAPGGQQLDADHAGARGNWVGVYESWPASSDDRPEPVFRKWLISGDKDVTSNKNAPKTETVLASSTVELAGDTPDRDAIGAGLVTVENGGYAWWVSENNMKAKLGNTVGTPATGIDAIAQMQAAPRAAHEPFLGDAISRDDPRFDKLPSIGTADLVSRSANPLFHDATTIADGLVTNVRAGGFREDLSFLLEKPYSQAIKDPLYRVGSTNGIHFGELWADHNIRGELETSGLPAHADGGTLAAGISYLRAPAAIDDSYHSPFRKYHQPTRIQHTLIYSMISRPKPGSQTGEYDLLLVVDPVVTLWNPFNVPVYVPRSSFTSIQFWAVPYRLSLRIQSPTGNIRTYEANVPQISGTGFNQALFGRGEDLVMRPGEVQVLSQSYNEAVEARWGGIDAKLGWNFGAGFEFSLTVQQKGDNGVVTNPNQFNLPPVHAGDRVGFSVSPAGGGQSHGLALTFSRQFIGTEDAGLYGIGNFSVDWTSVPHGERDGNLAASSRPEVFREIRLDPSYQKRVSEMEVPAGSNGATAKWPLFVFTMGFKTEEDPHYSEIASIPTPSSPPPPRYTGRSLLSVNPKSFVHDLGDLSPEWTKETPIQIGLRRLTSLNNVIDTTGAGFGFFGAAHTVMGSSHVITHSVPTSPVFSLGALQHSVADGLPPNADIPGDSNLQRVQYLRPSVSHAISNSFAPSIMASNKTGVTKGSGKYQRDLADHSFLANRALWDDYFYSSISPETTTAHRNPGTAYSQQKGRLAAFLGGNGTAPEPLPNSRFKPWAPDPQTALNEIFQGSAPAADASRRTAARILVDGAFNVNSTSINAWKSVLSSLKSASVPVLEPHADSGTPVLVATSHTPVAGLLIAGGGEIGDSDLHSPSDPMQWVGFRSMTDDQIGELAGAIVRQIRLRGPFTSLADFVNRRPGTNVELAISGALQSALDDESVSINEPWRRDNRSLDVSVAASQGYEFPEAEAGVKSVGAPGYVKQGDLLTTLGPLIAVRGDTFTIRAYGDARNAAGGKVKAYCEGVVRRIPDYVDPADEAHVANPMSVVNERFGRKFQVISFRYLNPEEI